MPRRQARPGEKPDDTFEIPCTVPALRNRPAEAVKLPRIRFPPVRIRAEHDSPEPIGRKVAVFYTLPQKKGWPRYRPGQFPRAEHLHRHTLKLPVPHDNDDLADLYLQAFAKVISNYRDLKEAHPA